jgi:hypothetical protein
MPKHAKIATALAITLLAHSLTEPAAAAFGGQNHPASQGSNVEKAQFGPYGHRHRHGPGPDWRGAPAWRGPSGWAGRPYWYARPWVRRPHYGTIFAGVALGTLITVAAVGAVPRRPHPDLCWYWADPYGNRGYWDYC